METTEKVGPLGRPVPSDLILSFSLQVSGFGEVEGDACGGGSAAGLVRRGVVLWPAAGGVDLFAAGRAWRSDRPRRGLRRVLLGAPGPPLDPAEPARQGAPAGLPRRALRRARDGGASVRPALEGGARPPD